MLCMYILSPQFNARLTVVFMNNVFIIFFFVLGSIIIIIVLTIYNYVANYINLATRKFMD